MENKRTMGVIILGWSFIFISAMVLASLITKTSASYSSLLYLREAAPKTNTFFSAIFSIATIESSLLFLLFMIEGIGLLMLKRWAYYIALYMPFLFMTETVWGIWLFGLPIVTLKNFIRLFINIMLIVFLTKAQIAAQFKVQHITRRGKEIGRGRFVFLVSCIFLIITSLPIAGWFLWAEYKFKSSAFAVPVPGKVEYRIQDRQFIINACEKKDIFAYRIAIPKDFKIFSASLGNNVFGWGLSFAKKEGAAAQSFIILDSQSYWNSFVPFSKMLNLKNTYDFQRKLNYSRFTPLYYFLRNISVPAHLVGIDEVTAPSWIGFVMRMRNKEKYIYDACVYPLNGGRSVNVLISSRDNALTSAQTQSILASAEFGDNEGMSASLFEKGKNALASTDFDAAVIHFMNALYFDQGNPEYAYYLGVALLKPADTDTRLSRVESAKKALGYCLFLNTEYQEAKALLKSVDEELARLHRSQK